jgi:enamine deaminase RidA (YjgF/YER057c/UK114 family)
MKLVGDGVEEQAEQVMQNLEAVLAAAGCSWPHVVKTTILCVPCGWATQRVGRI